MACGVASLRVTWFWSRNHSATPCLIRRTRMVVALIPSTLNGSSVANSGIPWSDTSRSSFSELYMLRAERSISSRTTNAKLGVGDFASFSRSAMPPSRGIPAAAAPARRPRSPGLPGRCRPIRRPRAQLRSNVRRSSFNSTSGSSLVSPIPPADRTRRPGDSPRPGTVAQDDSRGDRATHDRLTSRSRAASRVVGRNMNRRHMTDDHHRRTAGRATLLARAMDEIFGTHNTHKWVFT